MKPSHFLSFLAGGAVALSFLGCSGGGTTSSHASSSGSGSGSGGMGHGGAASSAATGTGGSAAGTGGAAATVDVIENVVLGSYPQAFDVYLPSNAERVVVFLHGAGAHKEESEYKEIGIRLDDPAKEPASAPPQPDTAWLIANRTAFVDPQGQTAVAGGWPTWSNYVMNSGVDDEAFLTAMNQALRAGTAAKGVPAFSHVYLAGHSNGGMMSHRMWCEAKDLFDAYGALSGPASIALDPQGLTLDGGAADPYAGTHACAPPAPKPYIAVIGGADTILQTKGAWGSDLWAINGCLSSGKSGQVIDPRLVNEQRMHGFRVSSVCGATPAAPTTSSNGSTTKWSDCGGKVVLEEVIGADHCVKAGKVPCLDDQIKGGPCANSLEAESGTAMRDVLVGFFSATE